MTPKIIVYFRCTNAIFGDFNAGAFWVAAFLKDSICIGKYCLISRKKYIINKFYSKEFHCKTI